MTRPLLRTAICDSFGIELPIFGFSHSVETVAAVTNAGGFGIYGATRRFDTEIREELAAIRRLVGNRPFGVDLVIPKNIPQSTTRAEMEAQIPDRHRAFVAELAARYQVPAGSGPGPRTRFIRSRAIIDAQPATEDDYHAEYLDLVLAIRVVPDLDAAMDHIATYGSNHTESIVSENYSTVQRFLEEVPSSVVIANASTRFADGGQLGLGAEIGISTSRLHAYGPMGAVDLTTRKYVLRGTGQTRN